jgi:hypothetical protein
MNNFPKFQNKSETSGACFCSEGRGRSYQTLITDLLITDY